VCVSGAIGDAVLGLDILAGRLAVPDPAARAALVDRYRRPEPRIALGRRLPGLASAAADISDGLVGDLAHICRASGVVARLDLDRLPLSVAARTALAAVGGAVADARARLATGGDDYELVFTIAAGDLPALAARGDSPPITVVGDVLGMGAAAGRAAEAEDSLLVQVVSNGRILPIPRGGYRHHIGAPPQNPEEK
jgi:thiamine-monophosphate kinase